MILLKCQGAYISEGVTTVKTVKRSKELLDKSYTDIEKPLNYVLQSTVVTSSVYQ